MLGEYKGISVRVLVKVRNMTAGSPLKHILGIAMPLMLGNICQQLYTVVDASIVGKGIGVEALAALGASDWFHWLFLGIVQGFAQGFAIPMAQAFGAEDHGELRRYLGSSILLAAASAAFVTGVALLSIRPVLELLSTPMDIRPMAISYLTVLFSGIPMVMAYNLMASLLRALGDGRTPLFAILMAACINIGLDILFVIGLGWGVASAAAATLIAQGCSSFFCLARLKRISFLRLSKEDLMPEAARCRRMMGIGLPISLQNTVIAVGGMILQRFANPMGVSFIAGYTATNKLYGLLEVASLSYGYAMSTYVGQNLGARKIHRIRHGVRTGAILGVLTSLAIALCMILFGRNIVSLFIDLKAPGAEEAVRIACEYLTIMASFLPILYLLFNYRSSLQGMGHTFIPMLSGVAEFIMRVGTVLWLTRWLDYRALFWAEVFCWAGAVAILYPGYLNVMRRMWYNPGEAPEESARNET